MLIPIARSLFPAARFGFSMWRGKDLETEFREEIESMTLEQERRLAAVEEAVRADGRTPNEFTARQENQIRNAVRQVIEHAAGEEESENFLNALARLADPDFGDFAEQMAWDRRLAELEPFDHFLLKMFHGVERVAFLNRCAYAAVDERPPRVWNIWESWSRKIDVSASQQALALERLRTLARYFAVEQWTFACNRDQPGQHVGGWVVRTTPLGAFLVARTTPV